MFFITIIQLTLRYNQFSTNVRGKFHIKKATLSLILQSWILNIELKSTYKTSHRWLWTSSFKVGSWKLHTSICDGNDTRKDNCTLLQQAMSLESNIFKHPNMLTSVSLLRPKSKKEMDMTDCNVKNPKESQGGRNWFVPVLCYATAARTGRGILPKANAGQWRHPTRRYHIMLLHSVLLGTFGWEGDCVTRWMLA